MNSLRILVVHNTYQHRGGEDAVVEAEIALLRSHGHEVATYIRNNDDIAVMPKAKVALQTLWSQSTYLELVALIRTFQPDVVHAHNIFPLISPSLYGAVNQAGIPVVQTLHNFRLLCPQAMFLRNGKVCEDCLGHLPWRGAVRGCYRNSVLQSSVLASMLTLHRAVGTWQSKVTRYIVLNEFCRSKFIQGGLPSDRLVVKPNFVDFEAPSVGERERFLFVGRLSAEKGLAVLISAACALDKEHLVRIAGTGPEAVQLAGVRCVQALGVLTNDDVRREMNQSLAVIVPSICFETFGMVVVEAFACGTPVIASRIGVLPNLVQDGVTGLLFEPGNAQDLTQKMQWAQSHPEQMESMGHRARALYEAKFSAENNYRQLISIYEGAIAELK
jgi:glycosyltransferase involved in cell wall biosynthesis